MQLVLGEGLPERPAHLALAGAGVLPVGLLVDVQLVEAGLEVEREGGAVAGLSPAGFHIEFPLVGSSFLSIQAYPGASHPPSSFTDWPVAGHRSSVCGTHSPSIGGWHHHQQVA